MPKRWTVAGLLVAALAAPSSRADDQAAIDELRGRIDALEKQNRELLESLRTTNKPPGVKGQTTKPGDDPQDSDKPPETPLQADTVKFLGLKPVWMNYQPWLETDDKSFRFHVGGRVHLDGVWADPSNRVQTGQGGTGKFDDGVNFRRVRLAADGWMYKYFDFALEVDFVQTVNDDPTLPANAFTNVVAPNSLTEAYASVNSLPYVGTVRVGNQKPPILLERIISSRFQDFMERSALFDAYFNRSNGFDPGIQIANWTENERLTWQFALMKNAQTIEPFAVGDGDYQVDARITGLPWYEEDGRYLMHLGFGIQYGEPERATAILRERWLLRNGPPTTQNTVALATLNGHRQIIAVPEFFMNVGPWSIQAEYLAHHMNDIHTFTTQSQGTVPVPGSGKSFFSQGAYVEVMYFLTGEYRPYEKTALHSPGARPSRVVPLRNFLWAPGDSGCAPFGAGAWQVGVRYTYSDLSNDGIYGGQVNEVTVGLNWFMNPNMKLQWNYDVGYRGQLGPASTSNGTYQGFGTRLAFDF